MNAEALLSGIRDADAHRGGVSCLRLFRVERALGLALREEVDRLCDGEPSSDVQEREHVTHWTRPSGAVRQFSLWNRSGDFADFSEDHDLSCRGKAFHHAQRYPRLAAFVGSFQQAINFRVNWLGPGAGLAPHEEHSLFISQAGTPAVRARFHLPLRTSLGARMMLAGALYRFSPRTLYYFNQGCVHGADNPGDMPRVHLVWDQLLTAAAFAQMFGNAPAPDGLQRLPEADRPVPVLGRVTVGAYARLAPRVTPMEAQHVTFSPVQ